MSNRDQWEDVDGNPIDFTDFLETFSNDLDSDSIAVLEEQTATVSLGIEFAADKSALVILSPSDIELALCSGCLLYTSPSPRDRQKSRMPSSA